MTPNTFEDAQGFTGPIVVSGLSQADLQGRRSAPATQLTDSLVAG
jgi:hypothetical protein